MKIMSFIWPVLICLSACGPREPGTVHYPSHRYEYTDTDPNSLKYRADVYIPVYSDIYYLDGTRRFPLTATLSLRNASLTDTLFVFEIDYFDSAGNLLRNYIDSTLMLHPMESVEFVVEEKERTGGSGANFLVRWGAMKKTVPPVIQAVMIGTEGQQGLSFTTDGIVIGEKSYE